MNKYQEALDRLKELTVSEEHNKLYSVLQELVDKETPMKPLNQEVIDWGLGNAGDCKNCSREVNYQNKYCGNCGQKLSWDTHEGVNNKAIDWGNREKHNSNQKQFCKEQPND